MTADLLYIASPVLSAIIPLIVFLAVMESSRTEGRTVSRLKGQRAFGICGICTAAILFAWSIGIGEFAIALMGIGLAMFFMAIAVISGALLDVARMDPSMLVGGKCRYCKQHGRTGVNIPADRVYTGIGGANTINGGFRPLRTPENPSKPRFGAKCSNSDWTNYFQT